MVGVSKPSGDMLKSVYDIANNSIVDKVDYVVHGQIKKKKTDTLKHSHDANADKDTSEPDGEEYTEIKRITFTDGLWGAIRIKWKAQNSFNSGTVRGWSKLVDKDGLIIGTEHDNGASNTTLLTYTEDIDDASFAPGDYVCIYAKNHVVCVPNQEIHITDFRVYYDENSENFVNT